MRAESVQLTQNYHRTYGRGAVAQMVARSLSSGYVIRSLRNSSLGEVRGSIPRSSNPPFGTRRNLQCEDCKVSAIVTLIKAAVRRIQLSNAARCLLRSQSLRCAFAVVAHSASANCASDKTEV